MNESEVKTQRIALPVILLLLLFVAASLAAIFWMYQQKPLVYPNDTAAVLERWDSVFTPTSAQRHILDNSIQILSQEASDGGVTVHLLAAYGNPSAPTFLLDVTLPEEVDTQNRSIAFHQQSVLLQTAAGTEGFSGSRRALTTPNPSDSQRFRVLMTITALNEEYISLQTSDNGAILGNLVLSELELSSTVAPPDDQDSTVSAGDSIGGTWSFDLRYLRPAKPVELVTEPVPTTVWHYSTFPAMLYSPATLHSAILTEIGLSVRLNLPETLPKGSFPQLSPPLVIFKDGSSLLLFAGVSESGGLNYSYSYQSTVPIPMEDVAFVVINGQTVLSLPAG